MGNLGFSFSWKRLLGITSAKQAIAKQTGISTSDSGIKRKLGSMLFKILLGKKG
jgi:hypothetical protein